MRTKPKTIKSKSVSSKLFGVNLQRIVQEDGQDIVEYVLVVALIACAATASMRTLATNINGALTNMASKLSIA